MKRKWHKLGQGGLLPPYILADFQLLRCLQLHYGQNVQLCLPEKKNINMSFINICAIEVSVFRKNPNNVCIGMYLIISL